MSSTRINSTYCSVDGCKNDKTNKHLSFFALPTDGERRKQWLEIIGRPDLLEKSDVIKHKSYAICSIHFEKDMIITLPRLKPEALPTKYLPDMPNSTSATQTDIRDVSTQTDFSTHTDVLEPIIVSVSSLKQEANFEMAEMQASDEDDLESQIPVSFCDEIPRKRTSQITLKDSNKRRKLGKDMKKIEDDLEVIKLLSLNRLAYDDEEITKRVSTLIEYIRGENQSP